jgi:hypothetical protein
MRIVALMKPRSRLTTSRIGNSENPERFAEQANCAVIQGPLRAAPFWHARIGRWVTRADLSLDSKAAKHNQASMSTANQSFVEATIHLDDRGILANRRNHRAG